MRIAGVILIIFPLITTIVIFNKKELLAPTNLFSIIYTIKITIPTILYYSQYNVKFISNLYLYNSVIDSNIYFRYCLLQTISYYFVLFGMGLRVSDRHLVYASPKKYTYIFNNLEKRNSDYINIRLWGILFTIIGFIDFMLIMYKVGGVQYFFTNLQYRTFLTRDMDLLSWILPCLQYGPLLILYSLNGDNKPISVKLLLLIVLSGFCSGLGGRKAVILLLFETIIIYHYTVKPISLKSIFAPKYIILGILVAAFFTIFVQFRTEGALESFLAHPLTFLKSNNQSVLKIFTSESYVPFYMAIIKYFDNTSLWHGLSYFGLITAIIPSSLFAAKPPVDDGMYLYSICQGRNDIFPIMRTSDLNGSSYPLETFGSTYANFGTIGLIIGMLLLGIIINSFYSRLQKSRYSFFSIIIYSRIIFDFELSTLRLFQLFQAMVIVSIIIKCTDVVRLSRKNI